MTTSTMDALAGRPARVAVRQRSEPFTIASTIIVILYALGCLFPFWIIISSSFTDESQLSRTGYSFFPVNFSLEAYAQVLGGSSFVLNAYLASIVITVVGTALALSATSGLAWVIYTTATLSRIALRSIRATRPPLKTSAPNPA